MMDLFDDFVLAYDEMERMNAALAYAKEHPEEAEAEMEDEAQPETETETETTEKTGEQGSDRLSLFDADSIKKTSTPTPTNVDELAVADTKPSGAKPRQPRMLQDFGKKIGGARKDAWALYRQAMQTASEVTKGFSTLKDAWPAPNYKKLVKAGSIPTWQISAIRAMRESLDNKPSRYHDADWTREVLGRRDMANAILSGEYSQEEFEKVINTNWNVPQMYYYMYEKIGHEQPLEKYNIVKVNVLNNHKVIYRPSYLAGTWAAVEKENKPYEDGTNRFAYYGRSNIGRGYQLFFADYHEKEATLEYAIERIKQDVEHIAKDKSAGKENSSTTSHSGKSDVYLGYRQKFFFEYGPDQRVEMQRGDFYIYADASTKTVTKDCLPLKDGFKTREDAEAYLREHYDELMQIYKSVKDIPFEREKENADRQGEARFGKDGITPEKYQELFGFYNDTNGVEFGNWVEGDKRQEDLNLSATALLDLATVLKLPPKALTLGSTLSLRFGSNGRGGKNAALAHYEPLFKAINLTKKRGAGSLAHEWFHALDNYIGKQGKTGQTYLSEACYRSRDLHNLKGEGAELQDAVVTAMAKLVVAMRYDTDVLKRSESLDKRKSKAYWGTNIEMAARCFEAYVKYKLGSEYGISNDYLVNIKTEDKFYASQGLMAYNDWKQAKEGKQTYSKPPYAYPYPTAEEMPRIAEAFDNLFAAIRTREDEKGHVVLYSASDYQSLAKEKASADIVPLAKLNQYEQGLLAFSENVLKISVCFTENAPTLHGVYDATENTIYLNRNSEQPLDWVLSHEAFHALKHKDPELHDDVLAYVEAAEPFTEEQMNAYRAAHKAPNLPDVTVKEELLADAFADREQQAHLIYGMAVKDASLATRLMNYTKRVTHRFLAFLNIRKVDTLKIKQAEAFNQRLDELTEKMQVNGRNPLADKENVLGADGLPLTMQDADKARYYGPATELMGGSYEGQRAFDVRMAGELMKKSPREIVSQVIHDESPCGRMPHYVTSVMEQAMRNRKRAMAR